MSHPRNVLNSVLQALFKRNNSRIVHESSGPQHNIIWTAIVYIDGIEYGRGEGRTQDAASDAAATQAVSELRRQYGIN